LVSCDKDSSLHQELFRKRVGIQETWHIRISGYSDSDYAGDRRDRKSTTGYYIIVRGKLVFWRSKKKDVVSHSNAEAEYRALAHTTCEMVQLNKIY